MTTKTPASYHKTAVVVLSAGNSLRMGCHKALLPFDAGHNFIQKIVSVYLEAGISKIVAVVNRNNRVAIEASLSAPHFNRVQIVQNRYPERERFYSIKCGLSVLNGFESCFIHNCDNPYISPAIIRRLLNNQLPAAATIPQFEGRRGHPVLLPRNIMDAVISHHENNCNFKSFLATFPCNIISVDDNNILLNINSRDDLQNKTAL